MNLIDKQKLFPHLLVQLLDWLDANGYEVTLGEAWRPPEMARMYAKDGRGIENSLHLSRIAIDLCLWKGGKYLTLSEDYRPAGEFWEKLSHSPDYECVWGGRFKDGNHFSVEHQGVR